MGFFIEKTNRNDFLRISELGYSYSCGYYTQNCWVDDDRLVLLRTHSLSEKNSSDEAELVLIDLIHKTEKVLVRQEKKQSIAHVVFKNTLYYVEDEMILCSIDVDTLERKEIYVSQTEPIVFPHMTADGRYLNWFFEDIGPDKEFCTCWRIDLESGEVIKMVEKGFLPPYKVANHFMICPTDPNTVFFAHEGDTTYITNRLWIAEKGKEPYNLAHQRLDENGNLIDCFGHESWSPDGKGVYFVKYSCSPEPPCGVGYVDLENKNVEILYSKYKYWHVCAAPSGRYLAADIIPETENDNGTENSAVCLIDMNNNTETILAEVHNHKKHPGHPHPQFNPSGTRICFHDAIDKDAISVCIMDI